MVYYEDKEKFLLNTAEMHYYAEAFGEFIDRMFIEVVMVGDDPHLRIHHVLLNDFECKKMLRKLEMAFPTEEEMERRKQIMLSKRVPEESVVELRWKAGIIMDQVTETIANSELEEHGGDNGIGGNHY